MSPPRSFKPRPSGIIYWGRVGLAIVSAVLCTVFNLTDILGITFGVYIYLVSYLVFRYVLRMKPEDVGSETGLYSIGVGAYFLVWLMAWIVLYTIVTVSG